ncbi:MAG: FAD-dependent oxidoreductase, partial [Polyangiaceae bacterium]
MGGPQHPVVRVSTHEFLIGDPRDAFLSSFGCRPDTSLLESELQKNLMSTALRIDLPRRVLGGFGRSVNASCRHVAPCSQEDLARVLDSASREGLTIGFRGSGKSYGDASLNSRGVIVDTTRMNKMISWDPIAGILEGEPGLTIEGVWRRTLEDGYWPAVVPGTMFPTLAGCTSMNIHGKNNFKVGSFGEQIVDLD